MNVVRTSITIPRPLAEWVHKHAKEQYVTVSAYLSALVREDKRKWERKVKE